MPFTIPNESDAFHGDQAEPDKIDIDILVAGLKADGVISGCAVTAQATPDMTVAVAVGIIHIGVLTAAVVAGNVTITTADATNPRIDLVVVNDAGTKSVTAGTAAANPVLPAIPANSIVLAAVYVPANQTAIQTNKITDKRVVVFGDGGVVQRITATTDVVNTTTETTLWSYDVPANLLGANGMLHVVLLNDYLNNSGANKQVTIRIKLGATTLFDDITSLIGTSTARRAAFIEFWLANVQATNVQQLNGRAEMSAATATTAGLGDFPGTPIIPGFTVAGSAAEDTTVAQTVSVTIQHSAAHANTSYRNRAGRVEVYP